MSAEEVKMLHEAIKLDRMSAEVWAWFTPEEWEMIDSLFAFWTTEDVNEELPVAGPQRRLERSLEQSSTEASDAIYSAAASSIYEDDEQAQHPRQNHIGASARWTRSPQSHHSHDSR